MPKHFTATLQVTETSTPTPSSPSTYDRRISATPPKSEREVSEVAKLVVRAESLEALRGKLAKHVELLEDS